MKDLIDSDNLQREEYWVYLQEWLQEITLYPQEELNRLISSMKVEAISLNNQLSNF
jgi:hypothetical protein